MWEGGGGLQSAIYVCTTEFLKVHVLVFLYTIFYWDIHLVEKTLIWDAHRTHVCKDKQETRGNKMKIHLGHSSVGVVAPRVHRIRTMATIGSQTPAHHPKMYPPKQPVEPQKTSDASTLPVFLGFDDDCQ